MEIKLLYLWIKEDENKILCNQGFNLGGKYHFEYKPEKNTIFIQNKKNYIEDFYNMSGNPKYGVKDITAIVGANGSGKSTFINLIRDKFTSVDILEFGESILYSGVILVTENEDTKLVTILYGENISEELIIDVKSDINHCIYNDKVTVFEKNKLNILSKKHKVLDGVNGFKISKICELDNMQTIYFSNIVDYFSGGNTIGSGVIKSYDISTNALINNDVQNINIYSNVNVSEAISRRLNISQLEVFKKYEDIRMLNFLTSDIELVIPIEMPNQITLIFFDFRRYNYGSKKEYEIIDKQKQKIMDKIMQNKGTFHKHSLAIGIVIFLVQQIIDVIPYIKQLDYEFLNRISVDMNIDYYGCINERDIYSVEYSFEDEIDNFKDIYNKITDNFIRECNSKQNKSTSELKFILSEVIKLYENNKELYQKEFTDLNKKIKNLEEYTLKNLYDALDKSWEKIEEYKDDMCLSQKIENKINNYLEDEIIKSLDTNSCESIKGLIDGIGTLIKDNYNGNYLREIGTFDVIYRAEFIVSEIDKLKILLDILWENIDEDSGKLILKVDKDKEQIKQFINSYNESNIIYKLCTIEYRNISSGERAFLNICSRFYSIRNDINGSKNTCENILVLIDEVDLYFHPQWQKELIYNLSHLLSKIYENKKIQVVLSSHSPLVLSDIQKCNIIFMNKDDDGKCTVCKGIEEEKETFAANIHTLFTDSFFIKDGLMGKLAKEKVRKVIELLTSSEAFKDDEKENTKKLIYSIGELLIRNKLINMYKQKVDMNSKEEIENLKTEMRFLSERIEKLEKN